MVKCGWKFGLSAGVCAAVGWHTVAMAEGEGRERIQFGGYVEGSVIGGDFIAINPAVAQRPATAPTNVTYADDLIANNNGDFQGEAQLTATVEDLIQGEADTYTVGGYLEATFDFDTETVDAVDGYISARAALASVFLGTDVYGHFNIFDNEDFLGVGPVYAPFSVRTPMPGHGFDDTDMDRVRLVLQTRAIGGVGFGVGVDGRGNWQLGARYLGTMGPADVDLVVGGDDSGAIAARFVASMGDFSVGATTGIDSDDDYYVGLGGAYSINRLRLSLVGTIAEAKRTGIHARDFNVALGTNYKLTKNLEASSTVTWFNAKRGGTAFRTDSGAEYSARLRYSF